MQSSFCKHQNQISSFKCNSSIIAFYLPLFKTGNYTFWKCLPKKLAHSKILVSMFSTAKFSTLSGKTNRQGNKRQWPRPTNKQKEPNSMPISFKCAIRSKSNPSNTKSIHFIFTWHKKANKEMIFFWCFCHAKCNGPRKKLYI